MKRLIMILVLFAILNVFAKDMEDMQKYLKDTIKLAKEGKKQEALKRFIWLYDHVSEYEPRFSVGQIPYLLGYWKALANQYPPALKALQEVRDKETELIKNGKGTYETFNKVISINKELMEEEKSIELFVFIDKQYPDLARVCWNYIASKIIAANKIDLVRKYEPDLMKKFNEIVVSYKTIALRYETINHGEVLRKVNEDNFVRETLNLITVVEAIKDKKMADQIRAKAFGILPDPRLK